MQCLAHLVKELTPSKMPIPLSDSSANLFKLAKAMKEMTAETKQRVQNTFDDYNRTGKTYHTMSALHSLAQYWAENEIIIERAAKEEAEKNGPQWKPDLYDEDSIGEFFAERDVARIMHDQTLIPMHRFSSIVMLYSTVERELLRLVENLEKVHGPQKLKWKDIRTGGGMLGQISKYCEVFFKFRLVDCSNYNDVTELQKIRDCIVHGLGDVSLSNDKDFLVKLHKKRREFFVTPLDDICIEEECIKQFIQEIWSFFVSVFTSLKWKIAPIWQKNKPEKVFEKLKK